MGATVVAILQLVIALGLINVWIVRFNKATGYRGGDAKNIVEEFEIYGLPKWFCYTIGALKVGSALALLAGFAFPGIIKFAAGLVAALMAGAVMMHFKVGDPVKKAAPATAMLMMSLVVCFYNL